MPLGSVLWVRDSEMVDGINRTKINTYNSATGQLLSAELGTPGVGSCAPYNRSCHPNWYVYEFGQGFDAAGNVTRSYEIETDALTQENTPTETRHYYDAADRLTFSNTMRGWIWFAGTGSGTFSDYRYDALGRRVLTRTRRVDATCATPCDAFIERTVYDGDQVLAEIRSSGQVGASSFVLNGEGVAAQGGYFNGWTDPTYPELFGVVLYAHGLGIDQPVHVLKRHPSGTWTGFTPLMDWRGDYYGGVRTDGSSCTSSTCPTDWPSGLLNAYGRELGALPTTYASWYGSLLRNRKDANGLTYLRNRYYDPTTGQFTQPDPIGLAGGLNLYGFAGGDPINFSDPFGLCPEDLTGRPCLSPLGSTYPRIRSGGATGSVGSHGFTRVAPNGSPKFHAGLDLLADVGTSVTAADQGVVVFAGDNGDYGLQVVIAHQNGDGKTVSHTTYSHLSVADVAPGQQVRAGETVGAVGRSGNASGANIPTHLHFEIRTSRFLQSAERDTRDPKPAIRPPQE